MQMLIKKRKREKKIIKAPCASFSCKYNTDKQEGGPRPHLRAVVHRCGTHLRYTHLRYTKVSGGHRARKGGKESLGQASSRQQRLRKGSDWGTV